MNRMARIGERLREFVRCTTKKYEKICALGFMVCKGLSAAIRKTYVAHIKVLSDLRLLCLLRL